MNASKQFVGIAVVWLDQLHHHGLLRSSPKQNMTTHAHSHITYGTEFIVHVCSNKSNRIETRTKSRLDLSMLHK